MTLYVIAAFFAGFIVGSTVAFNQSTRARRRPSEITFEPRRTGR